MKSYELKDGDYTVILPFMLNELKLSGAALIIYAKIYGFSHSGKGCYTGGNEYLAAWAGCSERQARNIIDRFEEKKRVRIIKRPGKTDIITCLDPGKKFRRYYI